MLKLIFLSFFLISYSLTVFGETIVWQMNHAPPATIVEGKYKGEGFLDLILKQLITALPQYEHQIIVSSMARSIFELQKQKNVCLPALFVTNKRKEFVYFSKASVAHPSHRIVFNRKINLSQKNELSLRGLLENKTYVLGLDNGRSFGNKIDGIITQKPYLDNVYFFSSESPNRLLHMVKKGRVDYTITYPFQVSYYNKYNDFNIDEFKIFKISGAKKYVTGQVACPKTVWGKKVIKDIDIVLKKLKPTKNYYQALSKWWETEAHSDDFIKYYNDVFLEN
ncbi:TIGR02285 family protein [Pseudoalteromonas denitrificans]|uniref:Solute-binding protein family 3/N-terminal domain-containing protein n=1 Tax=Pseudoalteromonas denitrificans DSM 6059 TaxID=1123010 RepID=A0A1I1NUZ1_9GAMM|nr:TIGR02285 family protein [Pseudoalteromonas denitrificans]SFC98553.1 conserved hypothetical protein [Pseudoalteromonas denitrificans DSM 6059]